MLQMGRIEKLISHNISLFLLSSSFCFSSFNFFSSTAVCAGLTMFTLGNPTTFWYLGWGKDPSTDGSDKLSPSSDIEESSYVRTKVETKNI